MTYSCVFHGDVSSDYVEGYEWYEKQSEGLGERFLAEVKKKITEIADHPEVFVEKGRKGFREAKVEFFPFMIVYKINKRKHEIFISSVHHAKKHPRKKYRR